MNYFKNRKQISKIFDFYKDEEGNYFIRTYLNNKEKNKIDSIFSKFKEYIKEISSEY